jgi:hypothetical protein
LLPTPVHATFEPVCSILHGLNILERDGSIYGTFYAPSNVYIYYVKNGDKYTMRFWSREQCDTVYFRSPNKNSLGGYDIKNTYQLTNTYTALDGSVIYYIDGASFGNNTNFNNFQYCESSSFADFYSGIKTGITSGLANSSYSDFGLYNYYGHLFGVSHGWQEGYSTWVDYTGDVYDGDGKFLSHVKNVNVWKTYYSEGWGNSNHFQIFDYTNQGGFLNQTTTDSKGRTIYYYDSGRITYNSVNFNPQISDTGTPFYTKYYNYADSLENYENSTQNLPLGTLKNIGYSVTKNATYKECFDVISWDAELDSNGNNLSGKTVTISAIPAYAVGASEKEWYEKSLWDWILNNDTEYTTTVNATDGKCSICWDGLIQKFGFAQKFTSAIVEADGSYKSHCWVYRVKLSSKTQDSGWITVYPFVSGDKKSIEKAMETTVYNSYTQNVLNSIGYSYTDNSTGDTVHNAITYNYNYETVNNYDNKTITNNTITNISNPSGTSSNPSDIASQAVENWFQKVIDFFNNTIGAIVATAVGGLTSAASGLVAKTGFLGECVAMVPQMIELLVASVSTHVDAVLKWNDISLMGTTLISAGSVNLDDAVVQYGLADLHTICKVCMDAGILLFLNFKVYKKALEILKLR